MAREKFPIYVFKNLVVTRSERLRQSPTQSQFQGQLGTKTCPKFPSLSGMSSDSLIMNYPFQSDHSKFYLILFYPTYPQRRALYGFAQCSGKRHGIYWKKSGMLFVKWSYLGEICWNMFWFCFVLILLKPCDDARLPLKTKKILFLFILIYC